MARSSSDKWTIGKLHQLKPEIVNNHAIERLRRTVNNQSHVFPFYCCSCGEPRTANILDPAELMTRDFTCADSHEDQNCVSPPRPKIKKSPLYLLPGSFVSCKMSEKGDLPWPAIIEECPDGSKSFIITGETPDIAKAYFVTYILPEDEEGNNWLGGFVAADRVTPFVYKRFPSNVTTTYRKAIEIARKSSGHRLAQRLIDHSFVAHVANLRGNPIISNEEFTWPTGVAKRESLHPPSAWDARWAKGSNRRTLSGGSRTGGTVRNLSKRSRRDSGLSSLPEIEEEDLRARDSDDY